MISVIIPVYNAESSIIKALDSVKNQTFPQEEFEIIVIDDGSTDKGPELTEKYIRKNPGMNILLLHQPNSGVSGARNKGLAKAKGDFIALLDADDEWLPLKTEKQMQYFENTGFDFLATARNGNPLLYPYHIDNGIAEITFNKLLIRNEAQPSTVIFRRKVFENTGYFNENQRYAEDVNYWLKVSFRNTMCILEQSLVITGNGKRSFGVSGLSANLPEMARGFRKNLKEMYSLERITYLRYLILSIFYWTKYVLLRFRTFYYRSVRSK